MPHLADIAAHLETVRRRINAAALRSHRSPDHITLVAVSKTFGPESIRAAAAAGQRVFAENRVQEAATKIDALPDLALDWHLIGHLQSNKARKAVATFTCIQSVDSLELLRKLDAEARALDVRPSVLIQVDLAGEATKYGVARPELHALVAAAVEANAVVLRGLMIVPPIPEREEDSRTWFRQLRDVRDDLTTRGIPSPHLDHLSMGMSHDFEVAIEEGATIVRVGTAIFGGRPATAPPP